MRVRTRGSAGALRVPGAVTPCAVRPRPAGAERMTFAPQPSNLCFELTPFAVAGVPLFVRLH